MEWVPNAEWFVQYLLHDFIVRTKEHSLFTRLFSRNNAYMKPSEKYEATSCYVLTSSPYWKFQFFKFNQALQGVSFL
jgi:hypothetical protein